MDRWWSLLVIGTLLATGSRLVAEEDDPFAEELPPAVIEQAAPLVIPAPEPPEPMVTEPVFVEPVITPVVPPPPLESPEPVPKPPVPRRPATPAEPSLAQQRVHERAAEEARQRKARIEQRRHGVSPAVPAFFPSSGPLANPSLFHIDPGIRVAFRPIELSGLEPLPNVRPYQNSSPKKSLPRPAKPRAPSPPQD